MALSIPPRLARLPATSLVDQRRPMSLLADTTAELWQGFQRQGKTLLLADGERYSVRVYQPGYVEHFSPAATFEKWAAVAAPPAAAVPAGLEPLAVPGCLYAAVDYRGPASEAPGVFSYIFNTWLPYSAYELDERPHFEILPPGYRPADPTAQEEV